jgi:uncharacterized protein
VRAAFEIGGASVAAGRRLTVELPIGVLANHQRITLPVHVVHGRKAGPVLFLSAAIHGDEVIGVEVIRRLLAYRRMRSLHGTLLAVPVVNTFGFLARSRYLPDRRDLNRCFPGSGDGSLAAQLANLFMTEVVRRSQYGIDLHSAARHRVNLPQIRADVSDPGIRQLANAFGAPVIVHAAERDGSLRQAAREAGVAVLLYEGGEAFRFDEVPIRTGVRGVISVLHALGMLGGAAGNVRANASLISRQTHWIRAPRGGVFRRLRDLGSLVSEREALGVVSDPFGESETAVRSRRAGLVIGLSNLPVVNQGDALFHVARVGDDVDPDIDLVDQLEQELEDDPLRDDLL